MGVVEARQRLLERRVLTNAGTVVQTPVGAGAASLAVTFTRSEPDARYGAAVTPSWLTTVAVTARSATGMTVSFGTVAPANAVLDYLIYR